MATRYTLDARITGTNESSRAWNDASNDARGFAQAIREIPNEVNVGIDLENVGNDISQLNQQLREGVNDVQVSIGFENISNDVTRLNREIQQGLNDVTVGIDFENVTNDVRRLNQRLKREVGDVEVPVELVLERGAVERLNRRLQTALKDQTIEVNVDYDRQQFAGLSRSSEIAANSMANLAQNEVDVGQQAIRTSNVIRSSGFLGLLGGLAVAGYAIGPAFQAAVGGAVALGSAASSAGVGAGLLGAAIFRLIDRTKRGEEGTKDLRREWERLRDQFTGNRSVFDRASRELEPLARDMLRLSNRIMPDLGDEATQVARAFRRSANDIREGWSRSERNSVFRILDNSSDVIRDLSRGVGRLGEGILNVFGSPAATRGARQLTGYFDDITKSFRDWSRTERARDQIANWLDRAETLGKGARDAIGDIARALGRFDDEDAKNVADAIRLIGRFAGNAIDDVRTLGRGVADIGRGLGQTSKDFDKFIDNLDGSRKGVDRLANKIREDITGRGPTVAGWRLAEWLKDQQNDHKEWRNTLDKDGNAIARWGGDNRRATKNASDDWNEHIGQKVVKRLWGDFREGLKDNSSATDNWKRNQDNATEDVKDSWAARIGREVTNEIIPDFIKGLGDAARGGADWRKDAQDDTKRTATAFHYQLIEQVARGVLPDYVEALGNASDSTDKWADRVKSILNGILSWLGMGGGGGGDDGVDHRSGSGSSRPQGGSSGGPQGLGRGGGGGGSDGGRGGGMDEDFGFSEGGIARPGMRGYVGDANEDEAVINLGRFTDASANAMITAMDTWTEKGWIGRAFEARGRRTGQGDPPPPHAHFESPLERRRREQRPEAPPLRSSSPDQLMNWASLWSDGAYSSGYGSQNWVPEVKDIAYDTARSVGGISINTYPDHGGRGTWGEQHSVDHWPASGASGDISTSKGNQVVDFILGKYRSDIMYYIWDGLIHGWGRSKPFHGFGGPHRDHVHATYDLGTNREGSGDVGGGGGSFGPTLSEILDRIRGRMPNLDLGLGPYGTQLSGAIVDRVWSAIEAWAEKHAGSGGGGGDFSGNSPRGLTIGEALSQGGWPGNKLVPASSVVWHESGGDAHAQNPSGARGLMQIMPQTARGVGASYEKLYDPVYNTSTGYKVYKQAGGFGPWVAAGRGGDYRDRKVTGYARGGITGDGDGLKLNLPTRTEEAFHRVAEALYAMTSKAKPLRVANDGGVGDGNTILAITNEASGPEAVAPIDRWTPEGQEAYEAMRPIYGAYTDAPRAYRRGGMVPRQGWDLVRGDTMHIHGGAADDAIRAVRQHVGRVFPDIKRGGGVNVEWAEGPATGTTSSSGRIRVDRHLKGTRIGMLAMAHEMVHAAGLGHNRLPNALMNAVIGPNNHLVSAERRTLERMYGRGGGAGGDDGMNRQETRNLMQRLNGEGRRRLRAWLRHHDDVPDSRRRHLLNEYGISRHDGGGGAGAGGGGGRGGEDDAEDRAERHNRYWHATHGGRDPFFEDPFGYGKERPHPRFYDENRHYGPSREDFPQWPYRGEGPAQRAEDRQDRGGSPGRDPMHRPGSSPGGRGSTIDDLRRDNDAANRMMREIWRDIRAQLKEVGIDLPSQLGIGQFASGGTLQQLRRNPEVKQIVNEALREYERNRREWLGSRR